MPTTGELCSIQSSTTASPGEADQRTADQSRIAIRRGTSPGRYARVPMIQPFPMHLLPEAAARGRSKRRQEHAGRPPCEDAG